MTAAAMTLFNILVAAASVVVMFRSYPDQSVAAVVNWVLLYTAGLAIPYWWSRRTLHHFRDAGVPLTPVLRRIAFYPVIAGLLTLLAALPLIFGAR